MDPQIGTSDAPYGIVGGGRLARHLHHYFGLKGLASLEWSRSQAHKDGSTPETVLSPCPAVLVLVSDDAIVPFLEANEKLHSKVLLHCSGSLVTPLAQGLHPLCTFGMELYDRETYETIPFVCEEGPSRFEDLFPALPNPHYTLSAELKPLYHSLCVLAGNFTTVLWDKLFDTFETQLELPREAAQPYLRQVFRTVRHADGSARTGPLTRGDRKTVHANLEALGDDPFQEVYRAVVQAVAPELLRDSP